MKAVVAAFNQEKALVGAFSVIVQPVMEPMDRFAALVLTLDCGQLRVLLVSSGLSGARGKTGIFLFLCMGQISTNMGEIFIYSVPGCDTDHQN